MKTVAIGYGSDTVTITISNTYKNNVLDIEETFTKYVKKNWSGGKSILDSTKTRVRYTSFNTANKCIEKVAESYSFSGKTWSMDSKNVMVYQNDTLLLRDTLSEVSLQTLTTYDYSTCSQVVSGINEATSKIDFIVAPNPANDQLTVSLGDEYSEKEIQVSLYNVQGQIVYQHQLTSSSVLVDVSNLPRGFYIVKIAQNNQFSTKKVVLN